MGDDERTLRLAFTGGSPGYVEYPGVEIIDSDQAVDCCRSSTTPGRPAPGPRSATPAR